MANLSHSSQNGRREQQPAAPVRDLDSNWRDSRRDSQNAARSGPSRRDWRLERRSASPEGRGRDAPRVPLRMRSPRRSSSSILSSPASWQSRPPTATPATPSPPQTARAPQFSQQATQPSPLSDAEITREGLIGRIVSLPKEVEGVDCPHYSSELTKQPHVNKRAGGHPTLVWDVYQRHEGGEMIARCLPVTSFGTHGGSIEEKYDGSTSGRSAWKHIPRYLPIDHNGETGSKFNVPVLRLIDGRSMAKQSYVHLDHFYEVEARFLLEDKHRGLRLEYESLCIAAGKLMDFCDGMIYRIRWAPGETAPKSPLDVAYGGCGRPRDLGRPARALVSDGHMHEGHRLRETRTERVTGWEHSKPAPQDPRAPRWFPRRRRAR